ncbi:hypothetical protein SEVIR_5G382501v4 [Setaria viridis]
MGKGVLEVHLVDAKGLYGNDFLGKLDPFVIVQYRSQERKSSVARDQGRNPRWNEVFKFQINSAASNAQHKLILRILDHDHFSSDDRRDGHHQPGRGARHVHPERGEAQHRPRRQHVPRRDQGRLHLHRHPGSGRWRGNRRLEVQQL